MGSNSSQGGGDKDKALELALVQIEKQFGKGSIMRLGGSAPLAIEVFGPESSGKTSLCLHVVAEAQKIGGIAAFIDAEHALDVGYARNLGVNVDELLVSQPDTGEQALEITEQLVRS